MAAHKALDDFLKRFIDREVSSSMTPLNYFIDDVACLSFTITINCFTNQDKSFPWEGSDLTFFQRRFDIPPPNFIMGQTTMFYEDPQHSFTSTILYGIEYDIVVFSALLYAGCDILFDNSIVSLLACYIFNFALVRHPNIFEHMFVRTFFSAAFAKLSLQLLC